MIKIIHLTSVHQPYDNRILFKECTTLVNNGYDVVLIAPYDHDEIINGVQLRSVPRLEGRLLRVLITTSRILRKALKENGDIYHIHDPELLPILQLLKFRGKHVIFDMHENMPMALLGKPWIPICLRPMVKFVFSLIERLSLWKCPVIFAENSYRKHYQWVEVSETILNTPIAEELLKHVVVKKYDHFTVGYLGRVAQQRGSVITLEVLSKLKQRGCKVHFVCIGPVSREHELEVTAIVDSYNLQGVRFHGWQKPNAGWDTLARCHVGLAVLQGKPNYVESYPTKMFEYMGLGLPVIASNFPLYKDIIEKNECGICVNPSDVDEIANAIQWLEQHPEKAEELGEQGLRAINEQFNWNIEASKLINFYESVI